VPELLTQPPPPEAIAAMAAIPGVQITPSILVTQRGPEGHLGPEDAGAILVLQATFADPAGAGAFWAAAVPLMAMLEHAPGFLRRYSFPDGPSITLIAFWRSADDARAFAATPEHRDAARRLYAERWQYSHFSAIWELTRNHGRMVLCTECDGITPAADGHCRECGTALVDVYAPAT
jgi:heme-degrading monooxygenase HmoA